MQLLLIHPHDEPLLVDDRIPDETVLANTALQWIEDHHLPKAVIVPRPVFPVVAINACNEQHKVNEMSFARPWCNIEIFGIRMNMRMP